MVYKKYIKRNGKSYGPYYYESKRVNGKVINRYVHPSELAAVSKSSFSGFDKSIFYGIGIFVLFLLVLFLIIINFHLTGHVSMDVKTTYVQGEKLLGNITFSLKQGELIPQDSRVILQLGDSSKEFSLFDLVGDNSLSSGNFFAEGSSISGSGSGYGIAGTKTIYPDVNFELKIFNASSESEFVISGSASKDNDFDYALEDGQSAELVPGSVKINGEAVGDDKVVLRISGNDVLVSTDYSVSEEGFGQEYLGDESLTLRVNISNFDIGAEDGLLLVRLVYRDIEIASVSEEIVVSSAETPENASAAKNETQNMAIGLSAGNLRVKNSKNDILSTHIRLIDKINTIALEGNGKGGTSIGIMATGKYDVEVIFDNGPVKKIEMKDVKLNENTTDLINVDDLSGTEEGAQSIQAYAISPTETNFSEAIVTVTAKGNELLKCKDWNFSEQNCYGDWTNVMDIVPGQEYTFALTADDPGFVEIVANVTTNPAYNGTVAETTLSGFTVGPLNSADYSKITSNDNVAFTIPGNSATRDVYLYINFTIPNNAVNITATAYVNTSATTGTIRLALWNFTSGSWQPVVSRTGSTAKINLNYTTSNFQNFVSVNQTRLMIYDNSTASVAVRVDYLGINVSVITNPNVTLVSPVNDSLSSSSTNFTCNASISYNQLVNITFYWTYTGTFISNGTTGVNGTSNQTTFARTGLNNRTILWNCLICSNASDCSFAPANYSVLINNPPTQSNPILSSSLGTNTTDENLTCYNQSTSDIDGDSVRNVYNWFRNSQSIMVLNLPFAGPSNATRTKDYTVYSNNGTVVNATWNATGGYDGRGAYMFNGTNTYLNVGNSSSLNLRDSITIGAWIKDAGGSDYKVIVDKSNEYLFRIDNSGEGSKLSCFVYLSGSWEPRISTTSQISTNQWHYVVCVWNNATGNHQLYVDGVLNNSQTGRAGDVVSTSNNVTIGTWPGGNYFNGTIDEVRIYNLSLSAQEVSALYANRTDLMVSPELVAGQNWTCSVTPNDGFRDGITLQSNNLTILAIIPKPSVQFAAPSEISGSYVNRQYVLINVTASDNSGSGLKNITYYLYNSSWLSTGTKTTSPYFTNSTVSADGIYYFNATAFDNLGNQNWTENRNVTVDTVSPLVSIVYPQNITYNMNVSALNYTVSDLSLQACWYSLNSGITNITVTCGNNVSSLISLEGSNTWGVWANDSVGNLNSSSVTFFKDTIAPLISIMSPQNRTYNNRTILVNISSNGDNIWFFNGTANETYTVAVYKIFAEGPNVLYAWANDSAGNLNQTNVTFNVDITAPLISIMSPQNRTYNNRTLLVNISTSGANYVWFFNGTANETYTTTIYRVFNEGSNTIYAWANDSAGNLNQTNVTFNVDITAPLLSISYPVNGTKYTVNVSELNYSVSGADSCWYSLNNGATNTTITCGNNLTGLVSNEGPNSWRVWANDSAGNVNSSYVIFQKKTTPLSLVIMSPQNTTHNNRTLLVNISSNGDAIWFFNGTANETYTTEVYRTFNEGGNTIYAYANDTFGNFNSSSVIFNVDTTVPLWNSPSVNKSQIYYGDIVKFNATWANNQLGGYIFAINQSGNWALSSYIPFSGMTNVSENVSLITASAGTNVTWYFWANDSIGNSNQTSVQSLIVQNRPTLLVLSVNQSTYPQGFVPGLGYNVYILFEARYLDNSNQQPITGASCNITNNEESTLVNLTYNPSSGNYTGNISTHVLYDIVNFTASCVKENYAQTSNSTSTNVWRIMYLQDFSSNYSYYNLNKAYWLKSQEPTGAWAVLNINVSANIGDNFVAEFPFCSSGPNCSIIRDINVLGEQYARLNVSISNNSCKPYLCFKVYDWYLNSRIQVCGEPQTITANTPTLVTNLITKDYGISKDSYIFMQMYLNCSSSVNESINIHYNYSGMDANTEFHHPEPTGVISYLSGYAQGQNNYSIGPNQMINGSATVYVTFINTLNTPKSVNYYYTPPILYPYSLIPGSIVVRNSTGGLLASDNSSLNAPENVTLFASFNQVLWKTEEILGLSTIVDSGSAGTANSIRNIEVLSINNAGNKIWNITLYTIYTPQIIVYNLSTWTNYSVYNVEDEWEIKVNITNSSGTYDITNQVVIDNTGNVVTFPQVDMSYPIHYVISAKDKNAPLIEFVNPSEVSGTIMNRNSIVVNVTAYDFGSGVANVTITLYNSTGLVNSTNLIASPFFANFTNLTDGIYFFNATAYDFGNNFNSTRTRNVTIDSSLPNGTIIYPVNGTVTSEQDQEFSINLSDNLGLANATLYIYNLTGLYNMTTISLGGVTQTTVSIIVWLADGVYSWFWEVIDLAGNIFTTQTPAGGGNRTIAIDTDAPLWSNPSVNKSQIYYGDIVKFNTTWTDNYQLAGYIFAINQSGNWALSSYIPFSGMTNVSENVSLITASAGTNVTWYFWANDSAGNENLIAVQNFTVQIRPASLQFSVNQSVYPQGRATGSGYEIYIPFQARYLDNLGNPVPGALCNVSNNEIDEVDSLTYNSTSGNYSGQISTHNLYDVVFFNVACTKTGYDSATNSTTTNVWFYNYIQDTENLSYNAGKYDTIFLKKEPPTGMGTILTKNISALIGDNLVRKFYTYGSGVNGSYSRDINIAGNHTFSLNVSINDSSCKPYVCCGITDTNLNVLTIGCGGPQIIPADTPTMLVAEFNDSHTIRQGDYSFVGLYLNCSSNAVENVKVYYNYTGQPANFFSVHAAPNIISARVIGRKQLDSNYTIGPNSMIDRTRETVILFNNTGVSAGYLDYYYVSLIDTSYPNSIGVNMSEVYNSTGALWATDNASLVAPNSVRVLPDNQINWVTETIPANSAVNETIHFHPINNLRDNENLIVNNISLKQWNINVYNIALPIVGTTVFNISVWTNYSSYGAEGDWNFQVNKINSSGSFDISSQIIVDGSGRISFPMTDFFSWMNYSVTATDVTPPVVHLVSPLDGVLTNQPNWTFLCNITNIEIANLTLSVWNSTEDLVHSNTTILTGLFNSTNWTFSLPYDDVFKWNCLGYDFIGNSNWSSEGNYSISLDRSAPIITVLGCSPAKVGINRGVTCNATISDISGSIVVKANVSLPNSSVAWATVGNVSNNYYFVFNYTQLPGTYNITWFANDSFGNANITGDNFSAGFVPSVIINYPLGQNFSQGDYVVIVTNISSQNGINSSIAQVTLPDGALENLTLYVPHNKDNFDLNSVGTEWTVGNSYVGPGQNCIADIDATVPGKAFTSIGGDGSPLLDTYCSLYSNYPLFGDFDLNVSFDILNSDGKDIALNLQLTDIPSSADALNRLLISWGNWTGYEPTYDVYAANDSFIGYLSSREVGNNGMSGRFRIRRVGNTFTFYTWNNTDSSWAEEPVSQNVFDLGPALYVTLESETSTAGWGNISVSWDDFISAASSLRFGSFSNTSLLGGYNVSIIATDNLGFVNDSEKTNFNISKVNRRPSVPSIFIPYGNQIINGIINITWSEVSDINNDSVLFNITLLNADNSFNATIVSSYGNVYSDKYTWDTSAYPDGIYTMKVLVFENETLEGLSNYDILYGNFTIDNTLPIVEFMSPTPNSGAAINTSSFEVKTNASDLHLLSITIILYNASYSFLESSSSFGSPKDYIFSGYADGLYYFNAVATDSAGNSNSTEMRNITIDKPPIIYLFNPGDGVNYASTSQSVVFQYSVSDFSVTNCSLIVNNAVANLSLGVNTSDVNQFTNVFGVGSYLWNISCIDNNGNIGISSTRSFSVTAPVVIPPVVVSPGGGGGGGGAAPTVTVPISVSPEELSIMLVAGEGGTREITVRNLRNITTEVTIAVEGEVRGLLKVQNRLVLGPDEEKAVVLTIEKAEKGLLAGKLVFISGGHAINVPVVINLKSSNFLFDSALTIPEAYRAINPGQDVIAQINLLQIGPKEKVDVVTTYVIKDLTGKKYFEESETFFVLDAKDYVKTFNTEGLTPGKYIVGLDIAYPGAFATSSAQFEVLAIGVNKFSNQAIVVASILSVIGLGFLVWVLRARSLLYRGLIKRRINHKV